MAFSFAASDLKTKQKDLLECSSTYETLADVVQADRVAGTLWKKDSHARNLHRLTSTLRFIFLLQQNLCEDPAAALSDCARVAYAESLEPIHHTAVKLAVKMGLKMAPSRERYLKSIGESEETAKEAYARFRSVAEPLHDRILSYFPEGDSVPMAGES